MANGASGFVAPALLQTLSCAGHRVFATSRRVPKEAPRGWSWRPRDEVLQSVEEPVDALVHLEVKQHVFACDPKTRFEFERVNVEGTKRWLGWCDRIGIERFVYFSSVKAVNSAAGRAGDELSPGPNPSAYGASKWHAEAAVRAWVSRSARRSAVILRPAVIYGPGNAANIAAMVKAIARNRFCLLGANSNIKSVVSIRNVTAATRYLLEQMRPGDCEIFCVTDPQSYTVRQLDAMIRTAFGKSGNSPSIPVPVARVLARGGDVFERLSGRLAPFDSTRLSALLEATHFSCAKLQRTGFVHPECTSDGISGLVNWYVNRSALEAAS